MSANRPRNLAITLRRSVIGYPRKQRVVVRSLGLRRIRHTVIRPDTPQTRGMVAQVCHLLDVKEV
ncbi:MAG TPA: 50S ribosomal protein L30 [Nitrospiria bacterium]|nr:50S ribosomal protein L30 [Nitrospiria bacterium]HUK57542.1 50S ribosomal protein L30 [Nitrospiria bacterium]